MDIADNKKHLFFMDSALEQAKLALKSNEVPIGAIIVDGSGTVIAAASNNVETLECQTGHAEVLAIQEACKKRGNWRLDDCSIYVTLEPCLMCFGLIGLSRVRALFYGAKSPLFGCGVDNGETFPVYRRCLEIEGGIRAKSSAILLRQFFEMRRKEESKNGNKKSILQEDEGTSS